MPKSEFRMQNEAIPKHPIFIRTQPGVGRKTGQQWIDGDYNYDGTVNALDFNALATNYGQSISSAEPIGDALGAVVPEPMLVLPFLGAFSILFRLKRTICFASGGGQKEPTERG